MIDINFQNKVLDLLDDLGEDEFQVADSLCQRGIKGRTSEACHCPIANLLMKEFINCKVSVDSDMIVIKKDDGQKLELITPIPISNFIDDFDNILFPELINNN